MKECITWSEYCREPSKIEGYDRAINDMSDTMYACHHRYETHFEDGTLRPKPLSADLLDELGYYYHRPPYELIIVTTREHKQLHHLANGNNNYATREKAKEAHKEQRKQWYQEHKAEELEQKKQYYQEHKEQIDERNKQYQEEHKGQVAEMNKQWYQANKDQYKCQSKVKHWIKNHPGSTNIPETWNEEDIKYFNERRQKNGC